MSVAAIVLAAGASRRLGQPKQLLMLKDETLLRRALRVSKEAGAMPVLVVLGAHHAAVRSAVQFEDAIVLVNEDWEKGLATSIQTGLRAVEMDLNIDGVLLLSCDQPRLTAHHLRSMIARFKEEFAPTIIASAYAEVKGVPAIFPREAFAALRALDGDRGASRVILHPPCAVIALPFEGGEVDIDLPEDIAKLG
jgi:molybdenum cofactor cytidylyltransferase